MSKQTVRTSKTRRQRGYAWEDTLVKRLRSKGWKAFRLGSPSTGLPDVVATNTELDTILAIEAKSGTTNMLIVEYDQIMRCINWLDAFDVYSNRYPILAFKFLSKKWKSMNNYKRRKKQEYLKIWNNNIKSGDVICKYDGTILLSDNNNKMEIILEDYMI